MTFKEYLIDAVGEQQAELIINNPGALFIVDENRIPATGKTALCAILRDKGYQVIEEWTFDVSRVIHLSTRREESIPKEKRKRVSEILGEIDDSGVKVN